MRIPATTALIVLLALGQTAAETESTLARGLRLVREGDLEGAITSLTAAVREMAAEPGRAGAGDLAQAHLHLGVAYALQDQDKAALASFREALRLDSSAHLASDRFPPRVVRLFQAARAATEAPPPATPPPAPSRARPAQLVVDLEHDLEDGRLQVFVDDDQMIDETLDSRSRRRLLLLHRRKGGIEATLDVVPGPHTVRVVVTWGDDSSKTESISADFSSGIRRRLLVRLKGRFRKGLSLEWG